WHGGSAGGTAAESVVISRNPDDHPGGGSTGWEVHCHGGVAAAQRIIEDLQALGAVVMQPDQWLRWQGEPLLGREARAVLSRTTSLRTAAIAMDQLRGAMAIWIDEQLQQLVGADALPDADALSGVTAAAAERLRFASLGQHLD